MSNLKIDIKTINNYYKNLELDIFYLKGRGVRAKKNFKKGEAVEVAPFIYVDNIDKSEVSNYVFTSLTQTNKFIFPLGFATLYNHSDDPNCEYFLREAQDDNITKQFMIFAAKNEIKKGDELTISYGTNWWKQRQENLKKVE